MAAPAPKAPVAAPKVELRWTKDKTVCMVFADGVMVRCPSKKDLLELPTGEVVSLSRIRKSWLGMVLSG